MPPYSALGSVIQELTHNPKTSAFMRSLSQADLPIGWGNDKEIVDLARQAYELGGTNSPFLQSYMNGSKLFAESGQPLGVFHGSMNPDIQVFMPSKKGKYGPGIYTTPDYALADFYANHNIRRSMNASDVPTVYSFYARSTNPLYIQDNKDRLSYMLKAGLAKGASPLPAGYDAVVDFPKKEIIIPASTQIKSQLNRGTFDLTDPNIYRSALAAPALGAAMLLADDAQAAPLPKGLVNQAIDSAETSIKQVPAVFKKDYFVPNTRNIDIGGGKYDLGTEYLAGKNVQSQVFDPFNRDLAHNEAVFNSLLNVGPADTATIANVLNVIREPEIRQNVINQASRAIKPEGKAYFQIYEGQKKNRGIGKQTKKGWQNNLPTEAYLEDVKKYFEDAVPHGNIIEATKPKDMGKAAWLMSKEGPVRHYAIPVGLGAATAAALSPEQAHAVVTNNEPMMQTLSPEGRTYAYYASPYGGRPIRFEGSQLYDAFGNKPTLPVESNVMYDPVMAPIMASAGVPTVMGKLYATLADLGLTALMSQDIPEAPEEYYTAAQ